MQSEEQAKAGAEGAWKLREIAAQGQNTINLYKAVQNLSGSADASNPNLQAGVLAADTDIAKGQISKPPGRISPTNPAAINFWKGYQERLAERMATGELTGTQLAQTQANFKATNSAMAQVSKLGATTQSALNSLDQQAPMVMQVADRVKRTGVPIIDEKWINSQDALGNADAHTLKGQMETVALEFARLQSGNGQPNERNQEEGRRMFTAAMNSGQLQQMFDWIAKEGKTKTSGYNDSLNALRNQIGYYQMPKTQTSSPSAPTTGKAVARFNPATGKIETVTQ